MHGVRPLCLYLQLSACIVELIFQKQLIKLLFIGSFINFRYHLQLKTPLSRYNFQLRSLTHHICNFIFFPSNSMVLILKSIPEKKQENSHYLQNMQITVMIFFPHLLNATGYIFWHNQNFFSLQFIHFSYYHMTST